MDGGPTHKDTFDLKPGHANGGPFKPIDTATPGIQISEHLPQIAKYAARHLLVEKSTRGARTRTQVRELDAESRVLELARMAGGANVTRAALAHAREMLKSADLEQS